MPLNIDALKGLVWFTSNTSGVGSYRSAGAKPGFRNLNAYTHGQRISYAARNGTDWETGYGTVSITGNQDLTRDEITESSQSNTAVNWPGSGVIEIYSVALPQDQALVNRTNVWRAQQDLDGQVLVLSPDGTVYAYADNTSVYFNIGSTVLHAFGTVNGDHVNRFIDSGAGIGPRLVLDRQSASPASGDLTGAVFFRGRSSTGVQRDYADIQTKIISPTNAAETAEITLHAKAVGVDVEVLRSNNVGTFIGHNGSRSVAIGKTTFDIAASNGIELWNDGSLFVGRSAGTPVVINRTGNDDGSVIDLRKGGVTRGSISIVGTGTLYNTTSDGRLKKDATLIESPGETLEKLRPVTFRWIEDDAEDMGFIAQEFREVLPRAVTEGEDGYLQMSHSNSALIALMVAELQSLRREVNSLKTQLRVLT